MLWLFFGIVGTGFAITLALVVFMFGFAVMVARICNAVFRRRLHRNFNVIPLPKG